MKSLRKRATLGLIVIVGVGLAYLLQGLGLNIGTGIDSGPQATVQTKKTRPNEEIITETHPAEPVTKKSTQ